jgi:hypothetical protein
MLRGLCSAFLILCFTGGGGGLPLLDGVIFHSRDQGTEILRPHFEASSACHADGCTVRSIAQQARYAPVWIPVARILPLSEIADLTRYFPAFLAEPLQGQPLSRAPPPHFG